LTPLLNLIPVGGPSSSGPVSKERLPQSAASSLSSSITKPQVALNFRPQLPLRQIKAISFELAYAFPTPNGLSHAVLRRCSGCWRGPELLGTSDLASKRPPGWRPLSPRFAFDVADAVLCRGASSCSTLRPVQVPLQEGAVATPFRKRVILNRCNLLPRLRSYPSSCSGDAR
jgi:hypothetical protein